MYPSRLGVSGGPIEEYLVLENKDFTNLPGVIKAAREAKATGTNNNGEEVFYVMFLRQGDFQRIRKFTERALQQELNRRARAAV